MPFSPSQLSIRCSLCRIFSKSSASNPVGGYKNVIAVNPLYRTLLLGFPSFSARTHQSRVEKVLLSVLTGTQVLKILFIPVIFSSLMSQVHRRLLVDDDLGVGEPLMDNGKDNNGIIYTGII